MEKFDIKNDLSDLAQVRASVNGLIIVPETMENLDELIDSGVDRMSEADTESQEAIDLARENLERIIDEMTRDAKSRNIDTELDYHSFVNVRMGLCPLWPFC